MKDGWFMRGIYNLFKYSNDNITALNQSKYFTGLMIIIINMAPRFMTVKLNKTLESYIKYSLNRNVLIFAILWMGTRDIIIAFVLTLVFMLFVDYLFNEESTFCCLPETFVDYHTQMREQDPSSTPAPTPTPTPSPTSLSDIKMGSNLENGDATSSPSSVVADSSQENMIQSNISGYSGY
jgi:hypothetical protein|tara:strand:- start:963 stop:1502 length:540 start_codon:yes stop_codon:yes gene_type:complete